jgi:RNA processing factor Prp31
MERKASREKLLSKFREENKQIAQSLPTIDDINRRKKNKERYREIYSTKHHK